MSANLFKMWTGYKQWRKGKKMDVGERPEYSTPAGILEAVANARQLQNQGTDNVLQSQQAAINSSAANSLDNVTRTTDNTAQILQAAAAIDGNKNKALGQANTEFANRTRNNQNILFQALGDKNRSDLLAFQDKLGDFKDRSATKSALMEAGLQNLATGWEGTEKQIEQIFSMIYGGGMLGGNKGNQPQIPMAGISR